MSPTLPFILFAALLGIAATPWLLMMLAAVGRKQPHQAGSAREQLTVSVLIPARGEAARIVDKVANSLALRCPHATLEVIVGVDGCVATRGALDDVRDPRVSVLSWEHQRGKAWTVSRLLEAATGELVVFTDASAQLPPDMLTRALKAFRDERVGAWMPTYSTSDGTGRYWRTVAALHARLAAVGAPVGAHGAAWMARRRVVGHPPADVVNDDFVLPFEIHAEGSRLVYDPACVVREQAVVEDAPVVLRRLRRTGGGNLQMAARLWRRARGWRARLLLLTKVMKPWSVLASAFGFVVAPLWAPPADPASMLLALPAAAVLLAAFASVLWACGRLQRPGLGGYALAGAVAQVAGQGLVLSGRAGRLWGVGSRAAAPTLASLPTTVRVAKRAFDIATAAGGLLAFGPLMAIVAALIKIDSPGAALYGQERMRFDDNGKPTAFTVYKFRSMRQDAEVASGPVWAVEDDPRVTRIGRLLRDTRLDELPQLYNVLVGEMSLIGPRPERPFFVDKFDEQLAGYGDRLRSLKPGITGWAQVHCGYDTSLESVRDKLMFDLAYAAHMTSVKNWMWMESTVFVKTVGVMAFGRGAR